MARRRDGAGVFSAEKFESSTLAAKLRQSLIGLIRYFDLAFCARAEDEEGGGAVNKGNKWITILQDSIKNSERNAAELPRI